MSGLQKVVSVDFSGSYVHLIERTNLTLLELLDASVFVKLLSLLYKLISHFLDDLKLKH